MSLHDEHGAATKTRADEARLRLAAIAESSEDAIIGKDLNGNITSWNKAAEMMFGYAEEDILGRPNSIIIPPDRRAEEAEILDRVRGGEKLVSFETERQCLDGRIIPVSLTISPIRNTAGEIIGISKIARNLSEVRRVNQELQRREALLRSILATVPDALIVVDAKGEIQSFSAAAEGMFGFGAAEVSGRNVSVLMSTRSYTYLARYFVAAKRGSAAIGRVLLGQRKDGSTFPMELAVGEVKLPGIHLFTGFVRDLTDRHDRERRLHELQAELVHVSRLSELGQMVSALAHEVNQPLTALANYLNGARRLLAAGQLEAAQEVIDRGGAQAARARQIIKSLRDLVRKGETERRAESLAGLIEEASALALVGVGQEIRLSIDIAENAAEATVDRIQIQQVLLNLMRNAVEAMTASATRELTITTRRSGEMIEIRVADTGPGLPEPVRSRLFQPFVTTKPQGIGVGLSISRNIAEAHGGDLRAEVAAGGGAVFCLSIRCPEPPVRGSATI